MDSLANGRFADAPGDGEQMRSDRTTMEYAASRQPGQYIDDVDPVAAEFDDDQDLEEEKDDSHDESERDLVEAMDQLNDMDWEEGAGGRLCTVLLF
jgi:hypothetical protein